MKKFLSFVMACLIVLSLGIPVSAGSVDKFKLPPEEDEPVLVGSYVTNEYDVLVKIKEKTRVSGRSVSDIEYTLLEIAELGDEELARRYGYNTEEIAILKSYDGSPIEENPQLRLVLADFSGYLYRLGYSNHHVKVKFSWEWLDIPMLWRTDNVTCAWVGVNSSNGPHALRFDDSNSICKIDYYGTDSLGRDEYRFSEEFEIDDTNVDSNVSVDFELGSDRDYEAWGKRGYMEVTLEEPVNVNNLQYSTIVFAYGHQTLSGSPSFSVGISGLSVSITPSARTEEMFNGSISVWSNGATDTGGDAE